MFETFATNFLRRIFVVVNFTHLDGYDAMSKWEAISSNKVGLHIDLSSCKVFFLYLTFFPLYMHSMLISALNPIFKKKYLEILAYSLLIWKLVNKKLTLRCFLCYRTVVSGVSISQDNANQLSWLERQQAKLRERRTERSALLAAEAARRETGYSSDQAGDYSVPLHINTSKGAGSAPVSPHLPQRTSSVRLARARSADRARREAVSITVPLIL